MEHTEEVVVRDVRPAIEHPGRLTQEEIWEASHHASQSSSKIGAPRRDPDGRVVRNEALHRRGKLLTN